jgi:hypothetical protein
METKRHKGLTFSKILFLILLFSTALRAQENNQPVISYEITEQEEQLKTSLTEFEKSIPPYLESLKSELIGLEHDLIRARGEAEREVIRKAENPEQSEDLEEEADVQEEQVDTPDYMMQFLPKLEKNEVDVVRQLEESRRDLRYKRQELILKNQTLRGALQINDLAEAERIRINMEFLMEDIDSELEELRGDVSRVKAGDFEDRTQVFPQEGEVEQDDEIEEK